MDEGAHDDLGVPWLVRCLEFAFPTYPEGAYVSYDHGQEGELRQQAEAFCVMSTAFLLATMRTERHSGQAWELQTLEVTRIPLRRIRQVQTTTELLSQREQTDKIESFKVTIEIEGDLPQPWKPMLTLPRKGDYRNPRRASEAAHRFAEAVSNSLYGPPNSTESP